MKIRSDRERKRDEKHREQHEAEQRRAQSEKLTAGLVQMTNEEFSSLCSMLPPGIKRKIVQQRLNAFAEQSS